MTIRAVVAELFDADRKKDRKIDRQIERQTDGRPDMVKQRIAFRSFSKAPKYTQLKCRVEIVTFGVIRFTK
jgi:hypothetical protein